MGRLNPNNEPRIGFPAFAAGLQGWLSDHGAGLPSPLAPLDTNKENVGNKENLSASAHPPLKLQMLANAPFTESSPSKQSLRKVGTCAKTSGTNTSVLAEALCIGLALGLRGRGKQGGKISHLNQALLAENF